MFSQSISESAAFTMVLAFWIGGSLITALLAHKKKLSWKRWLCYGLLWGVVGLFFVPWILLLVIKRGDTHSEQSPKAIDLAQGAKYSYVGGATGIAMDTERSIMRVKKGSLIKEYPFEDVREWRASLVSGGGMIGYGVAGGITALAANTGAKRENAKASGFYIKVRDIDYPEWRIEILDQANQNRWMEIFNQLINKN